MIDKYVLAKLSQNTDRIETVTFKSKTAQGTFDSYTLYRVTISHGTKDVVNPGRGQIFKETATFRVYKTDLLNVSAPDPKLNDMIVRADTTQWVVTGDVDPELQDKVFILKCQLLPS